jgi:hypothetical protein
MPLALNSYLLGVGTVVGALAFGFGGGVLLTHTAMEESPAGQTRVERFARVEPEPKTPAAPQAPAAPVTATLDQAAVAPNQVTTPDQSHPASVVAIKQDAAPAEQPAVVAPDPVPAAQAGMPKSDVARKPELETPREVQAAREPQPQKQVEQAERAEAKPGESRETDRSAERSRRYAERRLPDIRAPGMRQRRLVVHEQPAQEVQEVIVSRPPEQPHFDLFGGLFGRPADPND